MLLRRKNPSVYIYTSTYLFNRPPVCRLFVSSPARPLARSPARPLARSPARPLARSPVRPSVRPPTRSSIRLSLCLFLYIRRCTLVRITNIYLYSHALIHTLTHIHKHTHKHKHSYIHTYMYINVCIFKYLL